MEHIIIFKQPVDCIDYVKNIKAEDDILNSNDRKILFKARQYFIDNLNQFHNEDISYLLSNKHFKHFTNLQSEELMKVCNSHNKNLPFFLKQWAICNDKSILKSYLHRIAEKNPEQLPQFFANETAKEIIIDIFNQQKSYTPILVELAVSHDPVNILRSELKPEKIVQWLEINPEHAFKIANHFVIKPYENHNSLIKSKVFDLVISEYVLNKKKYLKSILTTNDPLVIFLTNLGSEFIDKFKKSDCVFLNSIFKRDIVLDDNFSSLGQEHKPVMTLNTAQYIYIKSTQNWEVDNAENILSHSSEIILKPIEINLNFYKYKENIFEYFFKNDKLNTNFVLGLKNEFPHLNREQQKMYVASCIKLLTKETIASSNAEKLTDLLEVVPNEMTNIYLVKAFGSLNEDVLSYVSHKILKYKLEKNLSDNTENSKQPKI